MPPLRLYVLFGRDSGGRAARPIGGLRAMRHLKKGRRADRAHQYRVVANRLGFYQDGGQYNDRELVQAVKTARPAESR
jgi:hypothetical protein